MDEFKTILCPTDFSEHSNRAIEYGLRFAKEADGPLLIAHIIHVASGDLINEAGLAGEDRVVGLARHQSDVGRHAHVLKFDDAKRRIQSKLEEARDQLTGGYPKCAVVIDVGDPYEKLLAIATTQHVDLIVVATRGQTTSQHLIIGSVAEKLVRHAPCPVLVVRPGAA